MKTFLVTAILAIGANAESSHIIKLVSSEEGAISGFIGRFPNLAVEKGFRIGETFTALAADVEDVEALEADPEVEYIVENVDFELFAPMPEEAQTAAAASWGIDRINQRDLPLDDAYTPFGNGGAGVTAYIIDTGVETDHLEFEGRARFGFNGVGGTNDDVVGHGTHVAGTVAGATFGVAPNAEIVAVKVCASNSCSLQGILSGVEWSANDARGKKAVGNMSLGGGVNQAIDDAVSAAISTGLQIAIASGNSDRDACSFSPARVPEAVTVHASTISDTKAGFSNFGGCGDLYAPGQDITSAWIGGATRTISGTSMAAPHVAGVMALYLGEADYTPAQLHDKVLSAGSANKLQGDIGGGSKNLLAYYAPEDSGEVPDEQPGGGDEPCSGLCCIFPVFC